MKLTDAAGRLRTALGKAKARRGASTPKKSPYEEVVVFDEDNGRIFRVAMPHDEIAANLSASARYMPDTLMPRYIGAALGYAGVCGALMVTFFFLLQWLLVPAITFSAMFGVLGALPGWLIGPRFGPKSQWIAQRIDGDIIDMPVKDYTGGDHPEASFAYELMQMRDLKFLYSGGASRQQKMILTTLIITLGCLVFGLFFIVMVFSSG